jgi:hypothetical protein
VGETINSQLDFLDRFWLYNKTAMKKIIDLIKTDPRYLKNIEYGQPRPGHPEGKIKFHIADLESNLERLQEKGIKSEDYWKLSFIIHTHDLFKIEAEQGTPTLHPQNHATLARKYACQYIDDADLLNIIQYHDEYYNLWKEYLETGSYDAEKLQNLLTIIKDWDLFLLFTIIDGCTKGKDYSKLSWFINEVKKYKKTFIDSSWILPP